MDFLTKPCQASARIRPKYLPYSQMSDELTKIGAKSRKIEYIWLRY